MQLSKRNSYTYANTANIGHISVDIVTTYVTKLLHWTKTGNQCWISKIAKVQTKTFILKVKYHFQRKSSECVIVYIPIC